MANPMFNIYRDAFHGRFPHVVLATRVLALILVLLPVGPVQAALPDGPAVTPRTEGELEPPVKQVTRSIGQVTQLGNATSGFVENQGQWSTPARYVARTTQMTAYLHAGGMTLERPARSTDGAKKRAAIRLEFEGASRTVQPSGANRLPAQHSYFFGNDPSDWRSAVPSFATVNYPDLYRGVTLRVRETSGTIEYDLLLDKGANLEQVVVRCDGFQGLEVAPDGSLEMQTDWGTMVQKPPTAWCETADGMTIPVACSYREIDDCHYGFTAPGRDERLPLVIDPVIEWATYLGGIDEDGVFGVAKDHGGNIIITGYTASPDFPVSGGVYDDTHAGSYDWFVSALSPNGDTLLWSTYIGGSGYDCPLSLALDADDRVYVTGLTASSDFPTTPGAFDTSYEGDAEATVVCLESDGSDLVYSTFLGGSGEDWSSGLMVDGSEAIIVGCTESADFQTTVGAYDTSLGGTRDFFVSRLNETGTDLVFSTLIGGSAQDGLSFGPSVNPWDLPWFQVMTMDASGNIVVGGITASTDFPTTPGSYDETHNGGRDGVVCSLSASGADLLYSTYLGGSSWETVSAVAVDGLGRIVVAGWTQSTDFPTTSGAYDTSYNFGDDIFVSLLSMQGNGQQDLIYSTYVGGASWERPNDIIVEDSGSLLLIASTNSVDFPTVNPYDDTPNGLTEIALFRISPNKGGENDLAYSTYIGGSGYDEAFRMMQDSDGTLIIAGAAGPEFPVSDGAYDTSFNNPENPGVDDAFILRFSEIAVNVGDEPSADGVATVRLSDVAPNPTTGILHYTIELHEGAVIDVAVFDVTGRRVQTLANGYMPAGVHDLSEQLSDEGGMAAGVYYLRMAAAGEQWVREFALVR